MNIRPLSPAVNSYAGQNKNKTSENPSFGMFRTPFPVKVTQLIRADEVLEAVLGDVIKVVTRELSGTKYYDLAADVVTVQGKKTIGFQVVRKGQRNAAQIISPEDATPDSIVTALNSGSLQTKNMEANRVAEEARKASEKVAQTPQMSAGKVVPGKRVHVNKYQRPQPEADV